MGDGLALGKHLQEASSLGQACLYGVELGELVPEVGVLVTVGS